MDEEMPLMDPSTWNGIGYNPNTLKNAHDKASNNPTPYPHFDPEPDMKKAIKSGDMSY